ncbi:MAG: nucleotide sugar dehydrogenase [Verrucomicrobia bacterium]|nr:nucleotide sugar dehydrogenase [Verrucomicrobiota bacterium]
MKGRIRDIVCIGAGYVGGPTMAVIADRCPDISVTVIDMNEARIAAWNSDALPVYELGLAEIVRRTRGRNLRFIPQAEGAASIAQADAIFISVNTPTKTQGEGAGKASDLSYVESCARYIAEHATGPTIVIEKSTMPVRAADTIKRILSSGKNGGSFHVLSNPEFLAEGTAIRDLEKPDRVLIGGENVTAIEALAAVYRHWVPDAAILRTGLWSAELSKLAANAFLAQRVSSINAISALCEATEADVDEVAGVCGADTRIGLKFLKASIGFGGSCFKKDLLSLIYLCEFYQLSGPAAYWQGVLDINEWQKRRIAAMAAEYAKLGGGVVAILGLAFKKNTNDFRESPAIDICNQLLAAGIRLRLQDERVDAGDFAKTLVDERKAGFAFFPDIGQAVSGAGAILILTEWDAYAALDWTALARLTAKDAAIFDGRGIVRRAAAQAAGFKVFTVGKGQAPN